MTDGHTEVQTNEVNFPKSKASEVHRQCSVPGSSGYRACAPSSLAERLFSI